jgi:hypothetical protein
MDMSPAIKEAIEKWHESQEGEFEFMDNQRVAHVDNQQEVDEYYDQVAKGCCGSVDVELETSEGRILYGFNYGH